MNDADQFLATQIKLVESDSVLRPVDARFDLRLHEHQAATYQSGRGQEAPVTLKRLKVIRPPNTYLIQIGYRSEDPQLAADAANAIAQSYLEHTYNIRIRSSASLSTFMERQLEELKAKMERSGQALAEFERDLNLINPDVINPEEKTNILASRLLQLNTDYTNAQGERLKKEAAYDSVRGGSLDAALAAPQGEPLRKLAEHVERSSRTFCRGAVVLRREASRVSPRRRPSWTRSQASFESHARQHRRSASKRNSPKPSSAKRWPSRRWRRQERNSIRSMRGPSNIRRPSARPTGIRRCMTN